MIKNKQIVMTNIYFPLLINQEEISNIIVTIQDQNKKENKCSLVYTENSKIKEKTFLIFNSNNITNNSNICLYSKKNQIKYYYKIKLDLGDNIISEDISLNFHPENNYKEMAPEFLSKISFFEIYNFFWIFSKNQDNNFKNNLFIIGFNKLTNLIEYKSKFIINFFFQLLSLSDSDEEFFKALNYFDVNFLEDKLFLEND